MENVILAFVSFLSGAGLMAFFNWCDPDREQEAIDRGFAEYDSKTGEWKWKEPKQ